MEHLEVVKKIGEKDIDLKRERGDRSFRTPAQNKASGTPGVKKKGRDGRVRGDGCRLTETEAKMYRRDSTISGPRTKKGNIEGPEGGKKSRALGDVSEEKNTCCRIVRSNVGQLLSRGRNQLGSRVSQTRERKTNRRRCDTEEGFELERSR